MAFFRHVSESERVRFSARRENALNDLLNGLNGNRAVSGSAGWQPCRIAVYNGDSAKLPIYSAVVLTGSTIGEAAADAACQVTRPSKAGEFCILQQELTPSELGSAAVLGITPARVTILNPTDDRAELSAGGVLVSSADGPARSLWRQRSTGEQLCLLQLGGSKSNSEYASYFKVIEDPADATKLKVIDGADPESAFCGETDLGKVSVLSIAKPTQPYQLLVYLAARYSTTMGAWTFTLETSTSFPASGGCFQLLATFANGVIVQRHVTGMIYFGDRCIL